MVVRKRKPNKEDSSMFIYNNKTIFNKITQVISGSSLDKITKKYQGDFRSQHFDTHSHVYSMLSF
ncbi:DUF4372 domain-containing protein [Anaeromonas gelatinilytica]|uniref:DUF4372 domain-containing protein n=1 Tax=Anaeromonas gelatinilytica TaxID=2683194 RepID=UPI003314F4CD